MVAIVLVLCAAFVPIAFLGGLSGEVYRQFLVTVSIAVVLSDFVALTLTPALCAVLLKPGAERKNLFFNGFNNGFGWVTKRYSHGLAFLLKRSALGLVLFAVVIGLIAVLFKAVPGGLVPDEDQGYYLGAAILPEGAGLARTDAVVKQIKGAMSSKKNINSMFILMGFNFSRRRWIKVFRSYDVLSDATVGAAHPDRTATGRRELRKNRRHQRGFVAVLQPACDSRFGANRWLRVLSAK